MNHPYSALKVIHHPDRLAELRAGRQPAPVYLQLVLSDYCNQDCQWCWYRVSGNQSAELFGGRNPKRFMDARKAHEILFDFWALGGKAVLFTGGGEPTVHPQFLDVALAATAHKLDVALVTNGLLMGHVLAAYLVRHATWVRVSLDAATGRTYARTRGGSRDQFQRVLENIRRLVDLRNKTRNKMRLTIGIGFVVDQANWHELVDACVIAREIGADHIRLNAAYRHDQRERAEQDWTAEALRRAKAVKADLDSDRFTVFNRLPDRVADFRHGPPSHPFCGIQHFTTYIGADLNVYRCCITSYSRRGLIGSLKDQTFSELWNSQAKREDFERFDARQCDWCMFRATNQTIQYAIEEAPEHVNFIG